MNENKVVYEGVLSKGFGVMPKLVATDINLSIEAKAIYAYICSYAGNGESAFPKLNTMLYHLQISKTRFYKHFELLKDHGYIEVQRRRKLNTETNKWSADSNLYIIKQLIVKSEEEANEKNNDANDTDYDKSIENTNVSELPHFEEHQNDEHQNRSLINKNSINKNSINKNSKSVCSSEKETKLLEMYKAFNIEKKVMPHSIKLLKEYCHKFDLDVFEEVFIDTIENAKDSKFKYMRKILEELDNKNIKTIDDFKQDKENYKAAKKNTKTKSSKVANEFKPVKTRFHNINDNTKNYTPEELEQLLKENQAAKYAKEKAKASEVKEDTNKKVEITNELVHTCIENVDYFNSLDKNSQYAVKDYINNKGGFMPLHIRNIKA